MWHNHAQLAAQGVLLPGYSHQDHSRASRDLREAPRAALDPAAPWVGEWDVLTRQALHAPEAAVISNELLAACDSRQADRAVRSLLPAEVHIVLTVRDFASLLPAEWQERIKCRDTVQWEEWLGRIAGACPDADRRHRSWFWNVHDTLAILDAWSQHLPPDHVHVITTPQDDPAGLLWARFAAVLGLGPGGVDLTQARANSSLGIAETEFLRRMNEALPADLPDWFYTRNIKQVLAHDVLPARPRQARLSLPPGRQAWARAQAESLVAGLRDAKFHIVGDLGELLPRPVSRRYAEPGQLARRAAGGNRCAFRSGVRGPPVPAAAPGTAAAAEAGRPPAAGPAAHLAAAERAPDHPGAAQRQSPAGRAAAAGRHLVCAHPPGPPRPVVSWAGPGRRRKRRPRFSWRSSARPAPGGRRPRPSPAATRCRGSRPPSPRGPRYGGTK